MAFLLEKLTNAACPPDTFDGFRGRLIIPDLDCQNNAAADATCMEACRLADLPWSDNDCCIGENVCLCGPLFAAGSPQDVGDDSSQSSDTTTTTEASSAQEDHNSNGSEPQLTNNNSSESDNSMPQTPLNP